MLLSIDINEFFEDHIKRDDHPGISYRFTDWQAYTTYKQWYMKEASTLMVHDKGEFYEPMRFEEFQKKLKEYMSDVHHAIHFKTSRDWNGWYDRFHLLDTYGNICCNGKHW